MFGNAYVDGSGLQQLMDYNGRADGNPVYVGTAAEGVAEGDTGQWQIQKLEYDGSNRIISKKICRTASWTDRASGTTHYR